MSLRDNILTYEDLDREIVTVPEWGGLKVEVRGLSAGARGRVLRECQLPDGNLDLARMGVLLVLHTLHDPETGERLFRPGDEEALGAKSPGALDRLLGCATRLSGMSSADARTPEAEHGPSSYEVIPDSTVTVASPMTSPTTSESPTPNA